MVSAEVLTGAPVEVAPWPVLASELFAWLRAVSPAIWAAVARRGAAFAARRVGRDRAGKRVGRLRAADRAAAGADIDVVQRLRVLPELRRHLHHHVILVLRVVDHRDLALAEGVVERVVDLADGQPEPRRGGAVDDEIALQPLLLLIEVDVGDAAATFCSAASIFGAHS